MEPAARKGIDSFLAAMASCLFALEFFKLWLFIAVGAGKCFAFDCPSK